MKHSEIYLDWLSFTFDDRDSLIPEDLQSHTIMERFMYYYPGFSSLLMDAEVMVHHQYYDTGIICNENILIQWDESSARNKGLNVSIPGHAIYKLKELFELDCEDYLVVYKVFEYILQHSGKLSRIDIPYDDYSYKENGFTPEWYCRQYFNGNIRSKMKKYKYQCSGTKGYTLYVGSRPNGKLLRIYDKNKESNGEIDAIRYEIELHNRYARNFMEQYMSYYEGGLSISFGDLITEFIEVIDSSKYPSNKSLCPLLPAWEEYLTLVLRKNIVLKLSVRKQPVSWQRLDAWITGQVYPAMMTWIRGIGKETFDRLFRADMLHSEPNKKWQKVLHEKVLYDKELNNEN